MTRRAENVTTNFKAGPRFFSLVLESLQSPLLLSKLLDETEGQQSGTNACEGTGFRSQKDSLARLPDSSFEQEETEQTESQVSVSSVRENPDFEQKVAKEAKTEVFLSWKGPVWFCCGYVMKRRKNSRERTQRSQKIARLAPETRKRDFKQKVVKTK
jgi:hypothetical protein